MSEIDNYPQLLATIKDQISVSRYNAARAINTELVTLYWNIGNAITKQQKQEGWGAQTIDTLVRDLKHEYPDMKGISKSNLQAMIRFSKAWPSIFQLPVGKLSWTNNIVLLEKCDNREERLFYAEKAVQYGWSRPVLTHNITSKLHLHAGAAASNFTERLPAELAVQAQAITKDEYVLDFLNLTETSKERDIENAILANIQAFLTELGVGFAFMGRQYRVEAIDDENPDKIEEFFIDLLFFHTKLKCHIIIELKIDKFRPGHSGQLNFYMNMVDDQLKEEWMNPTIGILLCEDTHNKTVEYSLGGMNGPMAVRACRQNSFLSLSSNASFIITLPSRSLILAEQIGLDTSTECSRYTFS